MKEPNPKVNGCYAGRKPCGCCIATAYDGRDKSTGKLVADWIANGLVVNHVTWGEFQAIAKEETYCACPHTNADTGPLFGGK